MSISTNIYHITIPYGNDAVHRITVKNTDETVKNITGATVLYTVRQDGTRGTVIFTKSTSDGSISLTDPTNGVLQVTISGGDTPLTLGRKYYYTCDVTLSGITQTVQAGKFIIAFEQ